MSLAIQMFWGLLGEDQRTTAVQLAREGESLMLALGAAPFTRSASTLLPSSAAGDVGAWGDEYEARIASGARGMPLSVLWSGISSLDMLRADRVVQALAGTATSAPGWDAIRERLRTAPEPVRRIADWFASRAVTQTSGSWWQGLLTYDDELARLHESLVRAWWWQYAQTLPTVAAATITAQQQQQATPGVGLPAPVIPSAMGTPITPPASNDIGLVEIALAALVFWALGR